MIKIFKFLYIIFSKFYFNITYRTLKKSSKSREELKQIWKKNINRIFSEVDNFEKDTGYLIDRNFFHELAFKTQVADKTNNKVSYSHGRLLYSCIRKYCKDHSIKQINILETGTARGFSSVCMAKALEDHEISGKIVTLDILPVNKKIFWNSEGDEEGKRSRAELLNNYKNLLEKFVIFLQFDTIIDYSKIFINRINFAFIDGAHDRKHLLSEFKILKFSQLKGDIIFFDDYSYKKYPNLYEEINKICSENNYSKKIINSDEDRCYLIATKK